MEKSFYIWFDYHFQNIILNMAWTLYFQNIFLYMHEYYITPKEIYTIMSFLFLTKYIFGHVLNFTCHKLSFFFCFQILQKSQILQNTIIMFSTLNLTLV